jgi:hypothetical protein
MKFLVAGLRLLSAPALISTALCTFGPTYVAAKTISLEDQNKVPKAAGAPTRFVESGFATGVSKALEFPIVGAVRLGLGPLKDLESEVLKKHYDPTPYVPTYVNLYPQMESRFDPGTFDFEKYDEFLKGPSLHVKGNGHEQLCPSAVKTQSP